MFASKKLKLSNKNNLVYCLLLFFNLVIPFSNGEPNGVCISQGGRFPPFSSEGKPPKKANKGPKDLNLCRVFRKKTCCDFAQTHPAFIAIRRLASKGEASKECLQLWELLECSICDPRVGVQPGPPLICASFCDKVFQACSNAYFSMDAITQVLAPCGVNDVVCGRASEWISNGTELCRAAGFSVTPSDVSSEDASCYGGKASLDAISDPWKTSKSEASEETAILFEDFQQWVNDMPLGRRVSWTVGGLVLTAGLIFVSKRKSKNRGRKLGAIQRSAKRLEAKAKDKSPRISGNKKGNQLYYH